MLAQFDQQVIRLDTVAGRHQYLHHGGIAFAGDRGLHLRCLDGKQRAAMADFPAGAAVTRERAKIHDDPITGARLLLALGDDAAAEVLLLARQATLQVGTMTDSCRSRRRWKRRGGGSAGSSATERSSSRS